MSELLLTSAELLEQCLLVVWVGAFSGMVLLHAGEYKYGHFPRSSCLTIQQANSNSQDPRPRT